MGLAQAMVHELIGIKDNRVDLKYVPDIRPENRFTFQKNLELTKIKCLRSVSGRLSFPLHKIIFLEAACISTLVRFL